MELLEQIRDLAKRIDLVRGNINTEEATKNALIMPFLQILGYDVFNPLEVVPEYTTDIGTKKGEKVDYAILKDEKPVIIIECKHHTENLNVHNDQLLRYFNVSPARLAILTNGITYQFFTDLDEANKMDSRPFLEFDVTSCPDNVANELRKFHKQKFDPALFLSTASELKYLNAISELLHKEFELPSDDFIKYIISKVYSGSRITNRVIEEISPLVKKGTQQLLTGLINARLQSAMTIGYDKQSSEDNVVEEIDKNNNEREIITTEEELGAFYIIKSILHTEVEPIRISYKDTASYFNILIDNSIRKTLCRLYLNGKKKTLRITGDTNKYEITDINDLYQYKNQLVLAVQTILAGKEVITESDDLSDLL